MPEPGAEQHDRNRQRSGARRIRVTGQVQGVGFRPFVYRLAARHGLAGSVINQVGTVEILVEGGLPQIERFTRELTERSPQIAHPEIAHIAETIVTGRQQFEILASRSSGEASIHIPADFFTCPECLAELHSPRDRRYRYPFINCTQCGPRYTLIRALPYDRPNTSMADFELCDACREEYTNPLDRRFHAEPIACPRCGPVLRFEGNDSTGTQPQSALGQAVAVLREGGIVAVKGIGGYHLMCDASDDRAVRQLRARKKRPHKPLAVMFAAEPDGGAKALLRAVIADEVELGCLQQPARPIVLLRKRAGCPLAESVAPGLDEVGVMLAYSPLHDLLLSEFDGPLVATSGNLSGEPVITASAMAGDRLAKVADAFLHHNRPIVRPADDSVVRISAARARPIRIGRGLAPLELALPRTIVEPVLALGGQMKASIALAWGQRMVVSGHIGEMQSPRSLAVFMQLVKDLQDLYGVYAERYLCDAHPGYASHRWAHQSGRPVTNIWHHHAHASMLGLPAVAGDEGPMLAMTWDGVGLGPDQSLWGGEALLGSPGNWRRFAYFRPFYLPGGELAGRAPWRSAAALCWELGLELPEISAATPDAVQLLHRAWKRKLNAPQTSAAGRLFDAASSLLGLVEEASFEGQGPMLLEAHAQDIKGRALPLAYPSSGQDDSLVVDWAPLVEHMLAAEIPTPQRAADWHTSLAGVILALAQRARQSHGVTRVGLTGGVFQNRLLTEQAQVLLQADGFACMLPEQLPVNDGGLCAGQVVEYLYQVTS